MSKPLSWARRFFRDVPLARAGAIRALTAMRPRGGARDGVLFLFYHDMRASERHAFSAQLNRLRDFGDLVSVEDALRRLSSGGSGRHVCLTFDDGCRGAFDHAFPMLAAKSIPAAFFVVAGWLDAGKPGIIGWDECRALVMGGMEVGSHSLTHSRLSTLAPALLKQEFVTSRARIEAETGRPCLHFACPWGQPEIDYRLEREPFLARDAGYHSFFTTVPRRAPAGVSPWALPRVRMEPGWGAAEVRHALSRQTLTGG